MEVLPSGQSGSPSHPSGRGASIQVVDVSHRKRFRGYAGYYHRKCWFCRWETEAYAAVTFGEASESAPSTFMDCTNAPGHCDEGDGNVVWSRVGPGRPDGASNDRSGLESLPFVSFLCFPFVSFQVSRKTTKHTQVCAGTGGRVHPTDRARRRLFGACPEGDAGRSLRRARLEGAQPEGQCVWESVQSRSTRTS